MIIYKYQLKISPRQSIEMSKNARILSVQFQRGELCMWAYENPCELKEIRNFIIVGTGEGMGDPQFSKYVATVQYGRYVWHLFEMVEE